MTAFREIGRRPLDGPRHTVGRDSPLYPYALRVIAEPPETLYIVGNPEAMQEGLAIIGARQATPYGLSCARRFGSLAAGHGIAIVSGGARGCDAAGHEAALECGAPTVAFMGGGCDVPYPVCNIGLFQRIVDQGGAVVSEWPWGFQPRPFGFRRRNRLIAGLAKATLIVEAGLPSGTFSTADDALAAGKEVLVVPGSIMAPSSAGANRLLYQGARPIVDDRSFNDALFDIFGCMKQETIPGFQAQSLCSRLEGVDDGLLAAVLSQPLLVEELLPFARGKCPDEQAWGWIGQQISAIERSGLAARYPDGRIGPAIPR